MGHTKSILVISILLLTLKTLGFSNSTEFEKNQSELKALVFLSATCPCSQSHVDHLNQLVKLYPQFKLFGVITDDSSSEQKEVIQNYYSKERFEFPIIKDPEMKLVKTYNALKTPHIVLLKKDKNSSYIKLYEGGVTDQRQFSMSKNKFLAENLTALNNKTPLPHKQGRSLGCYIRRF